MPLNAGTMARAEYAAAPHSPAWLSWELLPFIGAITEFTVISHMQLSAQVSLRV